MKYRIRKKFVHKNVVMFLSVVPTLTGTAAMWSVHPLEDDPAASAQQLAPKYQKAHDKQIDEMIIKEYLNEPDEFKTDTIHDLTQFG